MIKNNDFSTLGIDVSDCTAVIYAESAVSFLQNNTTIDVSDLSNLQGNAKLFILKYIELMRHDMGVSSESIAGMSQSFIAPDSLGPAIANLAQTILGDSYQSVSFGHSVKKWEERKGNTWL